MKGEQKGTICSCHRKEHKNYTLYTIQCPLEQEQSYKA